MLCCNITQQDQTICCLLAARFQLHLLVHKARSRLASSSNFYHLSLKVHARAGRAGQGRAGQGRPGRTGRAGQGRAGFESETTHAKVGDAVKE